MYRLCRVSGSMYQVDKAYTLQGVQGVQGVHCTLYTVQGVYCVHPVRPDMCCPPRTQWGRGRIVHSAVWAHTPPQATLAGQSGVLPSFPSTPPPTLGTTSACPSTNTHEVNIYPSTILTYNHFHHLCRRDYC